MQYFQCTCHLSILLFVSSYWRAFKLVFGWVSIILMGSVQCICVMAQSGRAERATRWMPGESRTTGISANLSGRGMFKHDTWAFMEYCLPKQYSPPHAIWLIYSFSLGIRCSCGFQSETQTLNRSNEYFERKKMNTKVTSKIQINPK